MGLDFSSLTQNPEAAGAVGALLSMQFAPGNGVRPLIFSFVCGVAVAWFVGPWLLSAIGLVKPEAMSAGAFMLGIMGANLTHKVYTAVSGIDYQRVLDVLLGILQRK